MVNLEFNLDWCANWQQDDRWYCTLFFRDNEAVLNGFHKFLENTFGKDYGGWRLDKQRHGVEIWFRRQEDMLTFKMLTQTSNVI
jgi:hypothetical protein